MSKKIIGYKATHNYICKTKKYAVGKTYSMKKMPQVCSVGFHYCCDAKNTMNYYDYNSKFKLLEIEDLSKETSSSYDNEKSATNKMKIVREITDPDELFKLLGIYRKYDENGVLVYEKEKWSETKYHNGQRIEQIIYRLNDCWEKLFYDDAGRIIRKEDSAGSWEEHKLNKAGNIIQTKKSNGYLYEAVYKNGKQISYKDTEGNLKSITKLRNGNTVIIIKVKGEIASKVVLDSKKRTVSSLSFSNNGMEKTELKYKHNGKTYTEQANVYVKNNKTGQYELDNFEKSIYENGNLIFNQDSSGNLLKIEYKNGRKFKKTTIEVY